MTKPVTLAAISASKLEGTSSGIGALPPSCRDLGNSTAVHPPTARFIRRSDLTRAPGSRASSTSKA